MLLVVLIILQPKLQDNNIYFEHEGFHIIQTLKFIFCLFVSLVRFYNKYISSTI